MFCSKLLALSHWLEYFVRDRNELLSVALFPIADDGNHGVSSGVSTVSQPVPSELFNSPFALISQISLIGTDDGHGAFGR